MKRLASGAAIAAIRLLITRRRGRRRGRKPAFRRLLPLARAQIRNVRLPPCGRPPRKERGSRAIRCGRRAVRKLRAAPRNARARRSPASPVPRAAAAIRQLSGSLRLAGVERRERLEAGFECPPQPAERRRPLLGELVLEQVGRRPVPGMLRQRSCHARRAVFDRPDGQLGQEPPAEVVGREARSRPKGADRRRPVLGEIRLNASPHSDDMDGGPRHA